MSSNGAPKQQSSQPLALTYTSVWKIKHQINVYVNKFNLWNSRCVEEIAGAMLNVVMLMIGNPER